MGEVVVLARLLARPLFWVVVAVALLGALAAYQVRQPYAVDVGDPTSDRVHVRNFHDPRTEPRTARTFRWSDAYGYFDVPGTGGGVPFAIALTLNPGRPSVPLDIIVNGDPLLSTTLSGGWQTLVVEVGAEHPQALSARDLVVELRTPGYPAPDEPTQIQGVMLDRVEVLPRGSGFVVPPFAQLGYVALALALLYLFLGRVVAPLRATGGWWSWRGGAGESQAYRLLPPVMMVPAAALVALFAVARLPVTAHTGEVAGPLTVAFALAYAVMVASEAIGRRIAPGATWAARVLGALVGAAFLVRFGALTLPTVNIIDLEWHMKWLRELLAGNWQSLYFPGDLSSVPREWGLAVIIPKSPLFYFVAAPLSLLPWSLEGSVKAFACLLDVSMMLFAYGFAARYGGARWGRHAGLWAALFYALNPLSYRSLAYGILPTILAQWLSVLAFALAATMAVRVAEGKAPGRGLLVGFFITLAASLVAFPTIAVFDTLVIGLFGLVWVVRGRRSGNRAARRFGWTVLGTVAGAWLLAIVSYYGQYIPIVLTSTLPRLLGPPGELINPTFSQDPATAGALPSTVHWTDPLDLLGWTLGYLTSVIPLFAGLIGLAWLWLRSAKGTRLRVLSLLLGAWMVVLPLFFAANYKVDMIGKHLFFTVVPLSIGAGIFLWKLYGQRGWSVLSRVFAGLIVLALAWTALAFWVQRLVQAAG